MQTAAIQYYHHGRFKVAGGVLCLPFKHTEIQAMKRVIVFPTCYGTKNSLLEVRLVDSEHGVSGFYLFQACRPRLPLEEGTKDARAAERAVVLVVAISP